MNYTNRMVSSDNMGYASYLMEQDKNAGELPGQVSQVEEVTRLYGVLPVMLLPAACL